MNIKEEIHKSSEEMLKNLGKLVAIDSQLGTATAGKPFGDGPAKRLKQALALQKNLGLKPLILIITAAMPKWERARKL